MAPRSATNRTRGTVKKSPQKHTTSKDQPKQSSPGGGGDNDFDVDVDPCYVELPLQEVWHRNMPADFPYGETPFMEKYLSAQIEEDLRRGREEMGGAAAEKKTTTTKKKRKKGATTSPVGALASTSDAATWSIWDLPSVSEELVTWAMQQQGKKGPKKSAAPPPHLYQTFASAFAGNVTTCGSGKRAAGKGNTGVRKRARVV